MMSPEHNLTLAPARDMMGDITSLHDTRLNAVCEQLKASGARSVLDLGCGSGGLLYRLAQEPQFTTIVGLEASGQAIRQARQNLRSLLVDDAERIRLIPGLYTEPQPALAGYDAAALVETIEHVKPEQLTQVERCVFELMHPQHLIVTTPNQEYNPLYGLAPGEFREADHKFEWSRGRFRSWCIGVARRHGYRVKFGGLGDPDPDLGHPTQTAFFSI